MKKCNNCGKDYPESYAECPYCIIKENNEEKKKKTKKLYYGIAIGSVAWICAIGIIITSLFNFSNSRPFAVIAMNNQNNENVVEFKDEVIVIDDPGLEKKIKNITYSESTYEYTLSYKTLPDVFEDLAVGDIFVVPSNKDSKNYNFQVGFSGKVAEINDKFISFTIPSFKEIFNDFKIDSGALQAENVVFMPENDVQLDDFVPNSVHTASIGTYRLQTNKFSFGDFSAETSYQKTDTVSQLEGYDLLAKKLSLKVSHKSKASDDMDIEVSGKVTLNYPAIKFNMSYDSQEDDLETYDVGLITNQSVNLKIKGSSEIGLPAEENILEKISIIDLKDTTDKENGKIVLGTLYVGYFVPVLYNTKNLTPIIGVCLAFQICLTANGKIELEVETSESGLLRVEANSNGGNFCELKNSKCPNPVLGEEISDGENYDDISMKSTAKGSLDFTAAVGIDLGFSILGIIPIKLANDVMNFELVTTFEQEENSKPFEVVEDLHPKDVEAISFYQFKTQSVLKINMGATFKIGGFKYDIGNFGFQNTLWNKVWLQYPKPVEFSISECDFGGVQLGKSYTNEEINSEFYDRKEELGKSSLVGEIKDKFLQSTVKNIVNKINYDVEDILEFLPIEGNYDIACFSDGAIYFLEDGVVEAELITGDEVYNNSYISHSSNDKFIRSIYSEPQNKQSLTISIGELGAYILGKIGLEEIAEYDGTNLSIYHYNSDNNANMDIYLDGSGDVIFILVY